MSLLAFLPIIGKVLEKLFGIIDQAVPDKDLAAKMKTDIQLQMMAADHSEVSALIEARAKVLVAEVTGQSWLQRNWRPILMLTIIAIVGNNYLLAPIINATFSHWITTPVPTLELPDALWNLMTLGTGGYIFGRTGEKMMSIYKGKAGKEGG